MASPILLLAPKKTPTITTNLPALRAAARQQAEIFSASLALLAMEGAPSKATVMARLAVEDFLDSHEDDQFADEDGAATLPTMLVLFLAVVGLAFVLLVQRAALPFTSRLGIALGIWAAGALVFGIFVGAIIHRGRAHDDEPLPIIPRRPDWRQRGSVLIEALLLFPIVWLFLLASLDVQRCTMAASVITTVAQQTAGTMAAGKTADPVGYARGLALGLGVSLDGAAITASAVPCPTSLCTVHIDWTYRQIGVWFPAVAISRTGQAVQN